MAAMTVSASSHASLSTFKYVYVIIWIHRIITLNYIKPLLHDHDGMIATLLISGGLILSNHLAEAITTDCRTVQPHRPLSTAYNIDKGPWAWTAVQSVVIDSVMWLFNINSPDNLPTLQDWLPWCLEHIWIQAVWIWIHWVLVWSALLNTAHMTCDNGGEGILTEHFTVGSSIVPPCAILYITLTVGTVTDTPWLSAHRHTTDLRKHDLLPNWQLCVTSSTFGNNSNLQIQLFSALDCSMEGLKPCTH